MNAKNNKNNGMNVIENKVIECEVTEESRKAYGRPSVNEEEYKEYYNKRHFPAEVA